LAEEFEADQGVVKEEQPTELDSLAQDLTKDSEASDALSDLDGLDFSGLESLDDDADELGDLSDLNELQDLSEDLTSSSELKDISEELTDFGDLGDLNDLDSLEDLSGELSALGDPEQPTSENASETRWATSPVSSEIDLDTTPVETEAKAEQEPSELDFNFDDFDLPDLNADTEAAPGMQAEEKGEKSDDALSWDSVQAEDGSELDELGLGDLQDLDFSDALGGEGSEVAKGFEQESDDLKLDGGDDFDFDTLEGLSDLNTETVDEESFGLGTLGELPAADEMDEVQTKIELAEAYIEMGDADGAKNILEEVLQEGNDAQKALAEKLIKQA
jgi:pilus assembly protein FimV